MRVEGDLFN